MKACTKCHTEKPEEEFHWRAHKSGRHAECKACMSKRNAAIYVAKSEFIKARVNTKRLADPEAKKAQDRAYYLKNREKIITQVKARQVANRQARTAYEVEYTKKRIKTDPEFHLRRTLRKRLWDAVGSAQKSKTEALVGCSWADLRAHLESKFTAGMTWANYGKWHVDHIRPCVSFDLRAPDQQRQCFHYTNLQPLWAADNLSKGDKNVLVDSLIG